MPDSRRAIDKIGPWVEKALDLHGHGEDIFWDTGIGPDQHGAPSLILVLWMPSGVVGTSIPMMINVANPLSLDEDTLVGAIGSALERTRQQRTSMLGGHTQNGSGPAPSGLYLPT